MSMPAWLVRELRNLGTESDAAIARRVGRATSTVRKHRVRHGIPSVIQNRWTPEVVAMLGRCPDRSIAEELGVSLAAVCARRRQLGIPAFQRRGGE